MPFAPLALHANAANKVSAPEFQVYDLAGGASGGREDPPDFLYFYFLFLQGGDVWVTRWMGIGVLTLPDVAACHNATLAS